LSPTSGTPTIVIIIIIIIIIISASECIERAIIFQRRIPDYLVPIPISDK